MSGHGIDEAAERLHRLTKELIRRYQFRDWNQICCYGISISQSHILDVLAEAGDLTMQQLARRMFKSVSTMTRVVAQLVKRGHVTRRKDPEDGRVVRVAITPQGKAIVAAVNRDLIEHPEGDSARDSGRGVVRGVQGPGRPDQRHPSMARDVLPGLITLLILVV